VLDAVEREPQLADRWMVPLADMLPGLAAVTLTPRGVRSVAHGRDLTPSEVEWGGESAVPPGAPGAFVRLLDPDGQLVAIGTRSDGSGLLHPAVVLM
jgi:hypothetical protein